MGTREQVHNFTAFPATIFVAAATGFALEQITESTFTSVLGAVLAGLVTMGIHSATAPEPEQPRLFTSGGQPIIR